MHTARSLVKGMAGHGLDKVQPRLSHVSLFSHVSQSVTERVLDDVYLGAKPEKFITCNLIILNFLVDVAHISL